MWIRLALAVFVSLLVRCGEPCFVDRDTQIERCQLTEQTPGWEARTGVCIAEALEAYAICAEDGVARCRASCWREVGACRDCAPDDAMDAVCLKSFEICTERC